jgi:hypothetical protein
MIKHGVNLIGIQPQVALAFSVVAPILRSYGQTPVITSAVDGRHKRNSEHYQGCAIDLRIWDFYLVPGDASQGLVPSAAKCVAEMQEALGPEFDVILEPDHIHLHWRPDHGFY